MRQNIFFGQKRIEIAPKIITLSAIVVSKPNAG
jgi:hypothetical protein